MIARSSDNTEATVKVHMKSILRKIQVANRTQADWALEHGHSADEIKGRLLTAACQTGGTIVGTRHFVRVASWLYMKSIAQVCFARVADRRLFCRPEELPLKSSHFAFFERWLIKGIV